jgi:hypothetical protein
VWSQGGNVFAQSNFAKIAPDRIFWPTARGGGREDLRFSAGAGCMDGPLIIIGGHEPKLGLQPVEFW